MSDKRALSTRLAQVGRRIDAALQAVNPPIQRGSTVLARDVATLYGEGPTYGLSGFDVHEALCEALRATTGARFVTLLPSGLAACTVPLLAIAGRPGAHVLVPDSVYGPTRRFCDGMLRRLGVRTTYYDPRIGSAIAALIGPETAAIMLESPGSLTFELQDAPAIAACARAKGVPTLIDDTWSAGVLFDPFKAGLDVSCQALTKHQGGHSDVLSGAALTNSAELHAIIAGGVRELGLGCGAAEDAYLTLRGMRTMLLRLERQGASGLAVARRLEAHPAIARVLHPALPSHPDHALFERDFTGAAGVFGLVLTAPDGPAVNAALERLELFGLGFSWAGYESLVIPCDPQLKRTAFPWPETGALIRLSIGLEDPADLIADLEQALATLV